MVVIGICFTIRLVVVSITSRQQFAETLSPTYACAVVPVTVKTVVPLTAPNVALIVDVPVLTPVATPAALIVATAVVAELHVTVDVKFCDVPSLKCPMAMNACITFVAIVGFAGVMLIVCNVGPAADTVSSAVPLMAAFVVDVALIVTGPPAATPVATPDALIVAIAVFDDDQFTLTAPVVPSEKCPVAPNGTVPPAATPAAVGDTLIDTNVAGTVTPVEPQTAPSHAVIVTLPGAKPKALPESVTSFVMETSAVFEELQVTDARVCGPPLLKVPVAVNRWNPPAAIEGVAGVTVIEVSPG